MGVKGEGGLGVGFRVKVRGRARVRAGLVRVVVRVGFRAEG